MEFRAWVKFHIIIQLAEIRCENGNKGDGEFVKHTSTLKRGKLHLSRGKPPKRLRAGRTRVQNITSALAGFPGKANIGLVFGRETILVFENDPEDDSESAGDQGSVGEASGPSGTIGTVANVVGLPNVCVLNM